MKPACMDDREYAAWAEKNRPPAPTSPSPCYDCLVGFALDMRVEGRCDGVPWGYEQDDDQVGRPRATGPRSTPSQNAHARASRDYRRRKGARPLSEIMARRQRRQERARELVASGLTQAEAARRIGVTPEAVRRYLLRAA